MTHKVFRVKRPFEQQDGYTKSALATPPQRAALDVERLARALHRGYGFDWDHEIAPGDRCREDAAAIARAYAEQDA